MLTNDPKRLDTADVPRLAKKAGQNGYSIEQTLEEAEQGTGSVTQKLPKFNSHYYQRTSRRYIIFPFAFLLFLLLSIFSYFDLSKTIGDEIQDIHSLNQLLAKTASQHQTTLLTQQIDSLQQTRRNIKSVVFYPINTSDNRMMGIPDTNGLLFENQFGVSTPVFAEMSSSDNASDSQQLPLGYIQTTLDIQAIRHEWWINNLPMFGLMAILSTSVLLGALWMVKRVTRRLPMLEKLSRDILALDLKNASSEQITQITNFAHHYNLQQTNSSQRWVFEKVLVFLLNNIKTQNHRLITTERELQLLQQTMLKQTIEGAKTQNTLLLELKMAIKRIQAGIQLMTNHYVSQEQQDAVEIIQNGTHELTQKMNQIIQLQRIERGQVGVALQNFDPEALVADLVEKYSQIATQKDLSLSHKAYHGTYALEGDTQKITTIIASLIENAIQYTDVGSVQVFSQVFHVQNGIKCQVSVEDTGIGIDSSHLQEIFDPFFQVNPASSEEINFLGVDLSLVKKLAQMINADIDVTSTVGSGSTFTVTFLVNDWSQHFERNILEHKRIAILTQQASYVALGEKFAKAGAKVTTFDDTQQVLNHVMLNETDALLIAPDFSHKKIMALVYLLRQSQQRERSVIICFYEEDQLPNFEELRAAGVDYFEPFYIGDTNQDYYVKSLLKLLS